MGRNKKKKRDGDGRRPRLILSFDEEKRREYLTGFHKRKVERKKAAIEEIKKRLKQEQKKLREERHQEYLKMLAEREEALEEVDELDRLVTAKTEPVQYDHLNHTVTVTTISNLDFSAARLLGLPPPEAVAVEDFGIQLCPCHPCFRAHVAFLPTAFSEPRPSKGPGPGLRRTHHPRRSRPEPYPGSPETLCCPSGFPLSRPRCTRTSARRSRGNIPAGPRTPPRSPQAPLVPVRPSAAG
ncbi:nucleolar protein 12 isoform 1-T1 [Megaptera novaeangliae]